MHESNVQGLKAALLSLLLLALLLGIWHVSTLPKAGTVAPLASSMTAEQIEYAKLLGKDPSAGAPVKNSDGFPTLAQMRDAVVKAGWIKKDALCKGVAGDKAPAACK